MHEAHGDAPPRVADDLIELPPPPTLASLPTVILEQILTTSFPWFTAEFGGVDSGQRVFVEAPTYAAVCKAWYELAHNLPTRRLIIFYKILW